MYKFGNYRKKLRKLLIFLPKTQLQPVTEVFQLLYVRHKVKTQSLHSMNVKYTVGKNGLRNKGNSLLNLNCIPEFFDEFFGSTSINALNFLNFQMSH